MLSFKYENYKTLLECRLVTSRGWEKGKAVCGESDTGFDHWILLLCIEIVYLIKLIYISLIYVYWKWNSNKNNLIFCNESNFSNTMNI